MGEQYGRSPQSRRYQPRDARYRIHGNVVGRVWRLTKKDTVFLTNDLFVLDGFGAQDYVAVLDENLNLQNTLTIKSPGASAGFVNVAGSTPADFDLVAGSPAIDQGSTTTHPLDVLNRVAPFGSARDIGAFESGASLESDQLQPVFGQALVVGKGCAATGGTSSTGGDAATAGGGQTGVVGNGGQNTSNSYNDTLNGGQIASSSAIGGTPLAPSTQVEEDGGCGCRTAVRSQNVAVQVGFFGLLTLLLRRTRQRRA